MADRVHRALAAPVLLSEHETVPSASVGVALEPDPLRAGGGRGARRRRRHVPGQAGGRRPLGDLRRGHARARRLARADAARPAQRARASRSSPSTTSPWPTSPPASCAGSRPCCAGAACCCPSTSWWRRRRRRASCASRPGCCARSARRRGGGARATGCRSGSPSNVSTTQFLRGELAADLRSALDSGGFPGAALDLEVSEETLLCDASAVAAAFGSLGALGVGVVLDRFGTGHASISALRRFRLRALKLDAALTSADGPGDGGASCPRSSGWRRRWPFPWRPREWRRKRSARACRPWAARKRRAASSRSRWTRKRRRRS